MPVQRFQIIGGIYDGGVMDIEPDDSRRLYISNVDGDPIEYIYVLDCEQGKAHYDGWIRQLKREPGPHVG
jgi:hypothetical protein